MTTHRPTDDCSSFERWLTPFVDRELDAVHTVEVEEHLDCCGCCRERVAFVRAMRASLRAVGQSRAPSSLRERMRAALAEEHEAEGLDAPVALVDRPHTSDAPHSMSASHATPRLVRLRYVFPLAAAAVLVLVLGAVQYRGAVDIASADGPRRVMPGITVSPLTSADAFKAPVLASLEPLDKLLDDLVAHHAEPLPPETTDPQGLQKFDRYVGVRVPRPKFDAYDARYLGARVHPVQGAQGDHAMMRTAMLQYMLRNQHRVTVYVFDPTRVPVRAKSLERRQLGRQKIYVGRLRGYSVAASERNGVGYALASDLSDDESAKLVAVAAR